MESPVSLCISCASWCLPPEYVKLKEKRDQWACRLVALCSRMSQRSVSNWYLNVEFTAGESSDGSAALRRHVNYHSSCSKIPHILLHAIKNESKSEGKCQSNLVQIFSETQMVTWMKYQRKGGRMFLSKPGLGNFTPTWHLLLARSNSLANKAGVRCAGNCRCLL